MKDLKAYWHIVTSFKPQPRISNCFSGRTDILKELAEFFEKKSSEPKTALLHGLGGMGKTQVCLKFLEQNAHMYDYVSV